MKTKDLLDRMSTIVESNVEAYKSDFYDYDRKAIAAADFGTWAWIVRDHGTQLARLDHGVEPFEYVAAVYDIMTVKQAYILECSGGSWTMHETDRAGIMDIEKGLDHYDFTFYFNSDWIADTMTGIYESVGSALQAAERIMEARGYGSFTIDPV